MTEFQQLGRYLLVERIARGGMADVYRAKLIGVEGFEKDVAIKRILPHWSTDREFVRMLIDEAKILLHLSHANIVQVFELNKEEGYFIVMEYVDGVDLKNLIARQREHSTPLPLPLILYIAQRICDGLHFAHETTDRNGNPLGIVHRDISPQNILLSYGGEVKITDFGIAKIFGKTSETVVGTLKGKFAYMSPEQALGEAVDRRTDTFAMGILLYEMVTADRCFKGANDLETLEAVKRAEVVFPRGVQERIPEGLMAHISKALYRDPKKRFQSAAEMRDDLRSIERSEGYLFSASDLKSFIERLCPEGQLNRGRREDELSYETKLYLNQLQGDLTATVRKTKILVGTRRPADLNPQGFDEDEKSTLITMAGGSPGRGYQRFLTRAKGMNWRYQTLIILSTILAGVALYGFLVAFYRNSPESPPPNQGDSEIAGDKIEPAPSIADDSSRFDETFEGEVVVSVEPPEGSIEIRFDEEREVRRGVHVVKVPVVGSKEFTVDLSGDGYLSQTGKVLIDREHRKVERHFVLAPVHYGGLVVAARPWGRVYLDGEVTGVETPLTRGKIPEGGHTLKVAFPPQNQVLSKEINIQENTTVRCQAIFDRTPRLTCR